MHGVRFAMAAWTMVMLTALALVTAAAVAQERQDENRNREPARTEQPATAFSAADRQLAYCLLVDNWKEVQVSQAAAPLLQNDDAKQFADQMVTAHSDALKKLQSIAGETGNQFQANRNRLRRGSNDPSAQNDRNETEVASADRPAANNNAANQEGLPFLQIKQKMAEQCVQTAKQELDSKQPNEIDRCFMTHQVVGHTAMLDALTVLQAYASPQLRPTLEQATETTRQHLEQAKKILKQLESQPRSTAGATNCQSALKPGHESALENPPA